MYICAELHVALCVVLMERNSLESICSFAVDDEGGISREIQQLQIGEGIQLCRKREEGVDGVYMSPLLPMDDCISTYIYRQGRV